LIIGVLLSAVPAVAGICTSDPVASDPRHEFQFFAGYSPDSATVIGTTSGARFVAAGLNNNVVYAGFSIYR
jgi:hypothetical protein